MTDYKPGTVALATVCGVPEMRVFRTGIGWCVTGSIQHADDDVTNIRPLVVLDTEFPRTVVKHLRMAAENDSGLTTLSWLADQIEAQTNPPKPTEPTGLGAVVEDSEGHLWVRAGSAAHVALKNCWRATAGEYVGDWQTFDRINAVRVLSEGVQP